MIHTLTHCNGIPFLGMYARDAKRLARMWDMAAAAPVGTYTVAPHYPAI